MSPQDILYIVLIVSVLVLTGTLIVVCIEVIDFIRVSKKTVKDADRIATDLRGPVERLAKATDAVTHIIEEVVEKVVVVRDKIEEKAEAAAHAVGTALELSRGKKKK